MRTIVAFLRFFATKNPLLVRGMTLDSITRRAREWCATCRLPMVRGRHVREALLASGFECRRVRGRLLVAARWRGK